VSATTSARPCDMLNVWLHLWMGSTWLNLLMLMNAKRGHRLPDAPLNTRNERRPYQKIFKLILEKKMNHTSLIIFES
jgi:hypothetical protein